MCLLLTAAMVAVFLPESSLAASKPFEKTKPCGAMATAVGSEIAVSWEKLKGAQGYYVYESISGSKYARVATTKSLKVVRPVKTKGITCRYVVQTIFFNELVALGALAGAWRTENHNILHLYSS